MIGHHRSAPASLPTIVEADLRRALAPGATSDLGFRPFRRGDVRGEDSSCAKGDSNPHAVKHRNLNLSLGQRSQLCTRRSITNSGDFPSVFRQLSLLPRRFRRGRGLCEGFVQRCSGDRGPSASRSSRGRAVPVQVVASVASPRDRSSMRAERPLRAANTSRPRASSSDFDDKRCTPSTSRRRTARPSASQARARAC